MLGLVLNEDIWFPAAAVIALSAVVALIIRGRRLRVAPRTIAIAACNLLFGFLIGILGIGHLVAVTSKAVLGILPEGIKLWFAIPFGAALALPAWWLSMQVGRLLAADHATRKRVLWLNAWLILVLASPGPAVVLAASGVAGVILLLSTRAGRAATV